MKKDTFAQQELDILSKFYPDSKILLLKDEVLTLCDKFSDSGQSGGSAPFTAYSIYSEIKDRVLRETLVEILKDKDSLHYEFDKEINDVCNKIKHYNLEESIKEISEQIRKLCLFEPISNVTGIDEEWGDVRGFEDGESWYQNKRCSALFKDGKDGKPYYIDAIIKRDQNGTCWSGLAWLNEEDYKSGDRNRMVGKKAYVKSFPFIPKTFYIDVKDVEVEKDDWESFIVDPSQLDQVWEYYDKN